MGDVGLLFTDKKKEEVLKFFLFRQLPKKTRFFQSFTSDEFAKTGFVPKTTIILEKGNAALKKLSYTLEPYLRKLGLNTSLVNNEIILNENFLLAKEGKPLSSDQCKILVSLFQLFYILSLEIASNPIIQILSHYALPLEKVWLL